MRRLAALGLVPIVAGLTLAAAPHDAGDAARYDGEARVRVDEELRLDLAATRGPLRIDGRIDGTVAMLDGDVLLGPEARIEGDVLVVGGEVRLERGARVTGEIVEFSASRTPARGPERGERRGWEDDRDHPDPWRSSRGWTYHGARRGDFSLVKLRLGPSYNRVEGLPIMLGPSIRTRGPNALRLEAMGILRTASTDAFGADRWGFRASLTQHLGPGDRFRFGATAFSTVQPLEAWKLSAEEASLATLLFHDDFRDHYGTEGWSAFLGVRPHRALDLRLEYRDAEHRSLAVAGPWTLFDGSDPWRLQPLVGEGDFRSLVGTLELDARDDRRDPFDGWLARIRVERGLDGDLVRPGLSAFLHPEADGGDGPSIPGDLAPGELRTDFTHVLADLRRYAPVGWDSHLGIRVVGGGSLRERPLPPQFQHALGGPGSLPGFGALQADCGIRAAAGKRDGVAFFPGYGCDRFVLGQVEYRGSLGFDLSVGDPDDEDDDHRHWHDFDVEVDWDPRWVVFFDAGRGWSYGDDVPGGVTTTGTLYDAGAGFLFDDVGFYLALPLNEGVDRDLRFLIRLQRRF